MLKGPMFYEGLLRVAMILKGPGIPSGSVLEDPVSNIDLAPSLLDWAGITPNVEMHGRSLKPLVENRASRDFAYGEWDLNSDHWGLDLKLRVARTSRHKLTFEKNSGAGELYDLQDDPHETTNLFDEEPTVRKELEDMIASRPDDQLKEPLVPSGLH